MHNLYVHEFWTIWSAGCTVTMGCNEIEKGNAYYLSWSN